MNKDIYSRRNGHAPNENMKKVLTDTIEKAKAMISKKLVDQKIEMTLETVQEAISVLKGAVMIVYPMVRKCFILRFTKICSLSS